MTKNIVSGIVGIVVGAIYLATALSLPEMSMGDRLGPKLFPSIVGIVAILSGIGLCIAELYAKNKSEKADFGFKTERDVWIRIVALAAVGIAYGLVIEILGFIVSTVLVMLATTALINKGRWRQNILFSLIFSVVCYGVFAVALKLSLPRGPLESLLPF